jgi:hypothetical protein
MVPHIPPRNLSQLFPGPPKYARKHVYKFIPCGLFQHLIINLLKWLGIFFIILFIFIYLFRVFIVFILFIFNIVYIVYLFLFLLFCLHIRTPHRAYS